MAREKRCRGETFGAGEIVAQTMQKFGQMPGDEGLRTTRSCDPCRACFGIDGAHIFEFQRGWRPARIPNQ